MGTGFSANVITTLTVASRRKRPAEVCQLLWKGTMSSTVHRILQGSGHKSSTFSPAVVAIIAVLGSAFLVVSYYRIFAKLCNRWNSRQDELSIDGHVGGAELEINTSPVPNQGLANILIQKIPLFQYKSGDGFTTDIECPVCLMDFAEDQQLRLLPKCAHAFHVHCIDTWLYTHCTCPVCRANVWPEQVMHQFPVAPLVNFYDRREFSPPGRFRDENAFPELPVGPGFSGRGHGRTSAPTLRGLLNSEDLHHHMRWMSGSSGAEDPGEESIRLYDSRTHNGNFSSRHHVVTIPSVVNSAPEPTSETPIDTRTPSAFISTESGPLGSSSKESPGNKSRESEQNRWHVFSRRSASSKRNPFSVVRSYSMGTSRRLVHALEFLDLNDNPDGQNKGGEKFYNPIEYGITETPDYPSDFTFPSLFHQSSGQLLTSSTTGEIDDPESSSLKASFRSASGFLDSSTDPDSPGAALKITGGRGRSLSFRSPFTLKRSLSGGRTKLPFKYINKGRFFSSGSPTSSAS